MTDSNSTIGAMFPDTKAVWENFVFGNIHNQKRLNIKKELKRIETNPILPLLRKINKEGSIFRDELSRQDEAYNFYRLSLARFLKHLSISIRFHQGPAYKRKYRERLTSRETKLARAFDESSKFTELDFYNCLFYSRILIDRTTALARHFLSEKNKPSFTSFADQKKFFKKQKFPYGLHEEYAQYVRGQTDWFDFPLKAIRDKFLVHSGPRHMQHFGFPNGDMTDLCLIYVVPNNPNSDLSRVEMVSVSLVTLSRDLEVFLKWFAAYGKKSLSTRRPS